VAYFRIIDPTRSVVEVEDYGAATLQIAQTTLRSVLGKAELDALLSEREKLNEHLQQIIDEQTEPWGIKVTTVEIKDVEIPDRMQHAMARQAEAERNRRAKVINAEGEFQASARLAEAADVIRPNPVTLQLRYLQALTDISGNEASTIVFPLPIDLISTFVENKVAPSAAQSPDQLQLEAAKTNGGDPAGGHPAAKTEQSKDAGSG
jgi:SPFH domain / Band 7 family